MSPEVSVIVPAHDAAAFIAPCLDSVLAQTMPDLEVLVVDDASTDGTRERVAAFADARIRCLRNAENRGPSAARNRAIEAARGEWLALLDADDAWLPERLERLVGTGRARQSDLVADDVLLTDATLRPTGGTVLSQRRWRPAEIRRVSAVQLVRHDLGFLKPMLRRSFLVEQGLRFDEALRHGEDFELMWRCLRRGARYDLVPEPYYLHRLRPGSLTSQRMRLFETTRATTKTLLAEPSMAEEPELAAALGARLGRIDRTLAYNRCRAALAGRSPLRAARALLGTPGALRFTLVRAFRGVGRRFRPPAEPRQPMKVFYVLDSLGVGGAERSLLEIARRLQGVEPLVCHLFPLDTLAAEYRAAGIRVESLGVRSKRGLPRAVFQLARRLRDERPDLLQLTGFYSGFVGRFAGRRAGAPIVDTFTNESYTPAHFAATPERSRWKLRLARRLDHRTFGWVRAVIAVSEAVRDTNCRALGVSAERVRVIHRGRDPELFRPPPPEALAELRRSLELPEGDPVLVNVSRLIPRKGQEDLIRALPRLRQRLGSPVTLLLVGEGHHRPALEAQARELGVERQVRFLGRRSDVPVLLHLADVFVFPSRFEGHPGALVEAMLAARPIVAADIPVHRETLADGVTGLLVLPGEVEALTARVAELLADAPLAGRLAQAAREDAARRFGIDRIAQCTRALYGEILGSLS